MMIHRQVPLLRDRTWSTTQEAHGKILEVDKRKEGFMEQWFGVGVRVYVLRLRF